MDMSKVMLTPPERERVGGGGRGAGKARKGPFFGEDREGEDLGKGLLRKVSLACAGSQLLSC